MRTWLVVIGLALVGCSLANREGVDASCEDLQLGAINACGEGIITSCKSGTVLYEVCGAKDACEQSWQEPGAYRCDESDPLPDLIAGGGSTGGSGGSGGTTGSSGGGANEDCASEAFTIATVAGGIYDVVIDGATAYFSGNGEVFSVPTAGGPTTKLATIADSCAGSTELAVGGGLVFVECNDAVYRVPVTGGTPTEEVSGQSTVGPIAADAQRLFWAGSSMINRQLHGGASETIPETPWFATFLQVSEGFVYWYGTSDIERVTVDGTTVQGFAVSGEPRDMKVLDGKAYVALPASVSEIDLTIGTEATLSSTSDARLVAANQSDVFWFESNGEAGIWTVPQNGGTPDRIVEGAGNIRTLDVDSDAVYFADGSELKMVVLR